jgi:hypothetical protein
MYCALVESDLRIHEQTILKEIEDRYITQLIFTGHSLGGGMAQIAHLLLQAQLDCSDKIPKPTEPARIWADQQLTLKCHTVTFAAPMTIFGLEEMNDINEHAKALMKKLSESSWNFVFRSDVVPRAFAYVEYIKEVLDAVTPEAIGSMNPMPLSVGTGHVSRGIIENIKKKFTPMVGAWQPSFATLVQSFTTPARMDVSRCASSLTEAHTPLTGASLLL